MREWLKEFRDFALRGNVMDLAIAFVIGAAFTAIVKSFVGDLIMPPLGLLLGHADFSNYFVTLSGGSYATLAAAKAAHAVTLNYGMFINKVVNFVIVALAMFIVIRQAARMRRKQEAEAPAPTTRDCPYCKMAVAIEASRCPHCTSELPAAE